MPFIGKAPETGAFRLIDSITTSATDTYALTVQGDYYFPASARNLIVSLNGVTQAPESAYTVSGSHIVFASALTANDVIDYILVIGDAVDIGTPSDGTVGNAQLKASLDFSGKTLTFSNDQISGNAVDGGTISNFASTGIDDNATSTAVTVTDSGIAATLTTAAQPNITSVGTLSALSVTGDLTVDTNTLVVDSTNNNVGIGTNSPNSYLEYNGLTINGGNQGGFVDFEINGTLVGEIFTESVAGVSTLVIDTVGSTTDIQFRTDANDRMRIDSDGNVGIGTPDPSSPNGFSRNLTISGSSCSLALDETDSNTWELIASSGSFRIYDETDERLRISNTGNVSIGSNASYTKLLVEGGPVALGTGNGKRVAQFIAPASELSDQPGVILGYDSSLGGVVAAHTNSAGQNLSFWTYNGSAWGERLRISDEGRVSNGTGVTKNYTYFPLPYFYMGASSITDEYLIISRYNDTGSAVVATGVDGEILFSRGNTGAGNAQEKVEISVQDAWTGTPRVIRFNTSDVRRFFRIDVITVDSQKYLGLRAAQSGGGSTNHIFFRGIVTGESTDSKLLTRVRESDSNVTVNTSGWMYPAGFEYRDDTTGGFLGIRAGGADVGQFKTSGLHLENGKGIDFGASSGSGSTATLLDDYEEGTWTPTYTTTNANANVSYNAQSGHYTKIGRLVYITCYLQFNNATSIGTGQVRIAGLPYTGTGSNERLMVQTYIVDWSNSFGQDPMVYITSGTSEFRFILWRDGSSWTEPQTSDFAIGLTNGVVNVSGVYMTHQ